MRLADGDIEAIAEAIAESRRSGEPIPAPSLALDTVEEAYRIQDAVAARFGPVEGWKVGAKGPDETPTCAPLLAGTVIEPPDAARVGKRVGVEVEIAYRIGRAFPAAEAAPDAEDILAAVSSCRIAMELCDTRWLGGREAPPLWLLADNQMNEALLVGPEVPAWRDIDFDALQGRLRVDGRLLDTPRRHPARDPLRLLVWLVRHCVAQRGGLHAGAIVTTGSWTGMPLVDPPTTLTGEIHPLQPMTARLL